MEPQRAMQSGQYDLIFCRSTPLVIGQFIDRSQPPQWNSHLAIKSWQEQLGIAAFVRDA
jgi:hypothetical protein